MNIQNWLIAAVRKLEDCKVPSARLDALILLEDALGKDRSWILAHPELSLASDMHQSLKTKLQRRASHEPLAYIRGQSDFYGRTFMVSSATLQPRPETETMIELLTKLPFGKKTVIADIGTGSGAIAITAKLELPHAIVHATEIQPEALEIAYKNCRSLVTEVNLHEGNLLEPLKEVTIDVILANLPYVPTSHTINEAATHEPAIAIFGGNDGLDIYRELFFQLAARVQKPKYILTESLPFQHSDIQGIASNAKYTLVNAADFIQVFKLAN